MTSEVPSPGDAPAATEDEDERPATAGELRTLRRWVAVAGVWAVAATAVALIALLDGNGDEPRRASGNDRVARELRALERTTTERLDELEEAVEDAASPEDLEELAERVEELEADLERAAESAGDAEDAVGELGTRLGELESRVDELGASGGGAGETGEQ